MSNHWNHHLIEVGITAKQRKNPRVCSHFENCELIHSYNVFFEGEVPKPEY